jgi:hypothetical protein
LLAALPRLHTLTLTNLRGEVDWSALGALRNLASLAITVSAREHMGTTSASIRNMGLLGVEITDGLVDALRRLKTLRVAELELASLEQVRRLAAAGVNVMAAVGDSDETLGVVHRDPSSGRYSLGLNLAGAFDVETNLEAEGLLRELLDSHGADLGARVEFDTEAGAVWMNSDSRHVLERISRSREQAPAVTSSSQAASSASSGRLGADELLGRSSTPTVSEPQSAPAPRRGPSAVYAGSTSTR